MRQVKGKNFGRFKLRSKPLVEAGKYRVRVQKKATARQAGASAKSKSFGLKYIDLDPGDSGPAVELFNDLLRKQAYFNTDNAHYGSHTERAVMAFRKVNGMARNFQATPEIFAELADGQGRLQDRVPERRQARRGRHLQAGDGARRRRQGQVRLPRRDRRRGDAVRLGRRSPSTARTPGFNSIGMYYSVYYNRGEATHGYHSVPPYPASHGCIRNPIPDSSLHLQLDRPWATRCSSTSRRPGADARHAETADLRAARARAGARRGDAVERADGAVLRRRAAGAPAAGRLSRRRRADRRRPRRGSAPRRSAAR